MKLINFNPKISISFYQYVESEYNEHGDIVGLVTDYDNSSGKPKEQHLLNLDDIPSLISYLEGCLNSSGVKKKKRRPKSIVHNKEPLKRHVMHYVNDSFGVSCSWIVPKGKYMTQEKGNLNMIEWPEMLFSVSGAGRLFIHVIHKDRFYNPTGIPNVFAGGSVCLGSVKLPGKQAANYSVNEFISTYETAFFETKFSPDITIKDSKVVYRIDKNTFYTLSQIIK